MISLNLVLAVIALVLAIVAAVNSWPSRWGMALPIAVVLLALIHVLGGVVVVR